MLHLLKNMWHVFENFFYFFKKTCCMFAFLQKYVFTAITKAMFLTKQNIDNLPCRKTKNFPRGVPKNLHNTFQVRSYSFNLFVLYTRFLCDLKNAQKEVEKSVKIKNTRSKNMCNLEKKRLGLNMKMDNVFFDR